MTLNLNDFSDVLVTQAQHKKFCVALSGGLDSVVLLHLMREFCRDRANVSLRAVHIHHGLNPKASAWQTHCEQLCAAWQIPMCSYRLQLEISPGDSLEAVARDARYRQLTQALQAEECLLTAHHADDQVETLLLQLMRGAGVHGLSAMPMQRRMKEGALLRPLLGVTRASLEGYAKAHELSWVEDDSNTNLQFDRNYLRHSVIPLLKARWPSLDKTLTRSAQHCATAAELLDEQAEQDLRFTLESDHALNIDRLLSLSLLRQHQVVRYWLHVLGYRRPSTKKLNEIFNHMLHVRQDAAPCVTLEEASVRRYRRALYVTPSVPQELGHLQYDWRVPEPLELPGLGKLTVEFARGRGLRWQADQPHYTVRFRQGGERIKPVGSRCTQTLKKLLQSAGVPPWQRDRIPLLFQENTLVMVVGYWISDDHAAKADEEGFCVSAVPFYHPPEPNT